jgi:hypothetical protein
MLGKLSMIGAVAAIIMIPHSAVRPSRGRFPRVDDSTALSSCVELCQALPTKPTTQSLRRVRPQSSRLQGSRGRAAAIRHPHGCFGQMRARQKMRSRASTSLAPGCLSPEYSTDWRKLRSSTAHCRNCIAMSGRKPLRTRRRQPQTKGHKSVASCKGSHDTQQCCAPAGTCPSPRTGRAGREGEKILGGN